MPSSKNPERLFSSIWEQVGRHYCPFLLASPILPTTTLPSQLKKLLPSHLPPYLASSFLHLVAIFFFYPSCLCMKQQIDVAHNFYFDLTRCGQPGPWTGNKIHQRGQEKLQVKPSLLPLSLVFPYLLIHFLYKQTYTIDTLNALSVGEPDIEVLKCYQGRHESPDCVTSTYCKCHRIVYVFVGHFRCLRLSHCPDRTKLQQVSGSKITKQKHRGVRCWRDKAISPYKTGSPHTNTFPFESTLILEGVCISSAHDTYIYYAFILLQ